MRRKEIFILILIIGILAAANQFSQAQTYQLLEPLPRVGGAEAQEAPSLSNYLVWVFNFAIAMAAILAVLMIVIGGIQYMTAYGNPGAIGDAKNRITQALLGLVLAICAWLILYTINPDLVKGNLSIKPIPYTPYTPPSISFPTGPTGPEEKPQPGRPSVLLYSVTSPEACANMGGQAFSPCKDYCLATPGLCSASTVCCGVKP